MSDDIAQPHFNNLFKEIHEYAMTRNLPQWIINNIIRGEFLSMFPYDIRYKKQDWDNQFIINDRNENTSFEGGKNELAWVLSFTDEELLAMEPCLTRYEQHDIGLDFRYGDYTYQIKTAEYGSEGYDLLVRTEYTKRSQQADFIVFIDVKEALAYTIELGDLRLLQSTLVPYGDKFFIPMGNKPGTKNVFAAAIKHQPPGGWVRELPDFVKKVKPNE